MTTPDYDYIIVGGGTAGLVLANRLSENPETRVVVVEAGGDAGADPRVTIPAMFTAAMGTELDWGYTTTPQRGLNGRRIGHAQGKLLGGSSAINVQCLIPPSASDLTTWENLGNKGWNSGLLRYLQVIFSLDSPDEETTKHLNTAWAKEFAEASHGPVKASFPDVKENPLGKAWVETIEHLGYKLSASPFSGHSTGPYSVPCTVDAGTKTRSHSGTGYYYPVSQRENLDVLTSAVVGKVLLDTSEGSAKPRAIGIEFQRAEAVETLHARKEVILSAGVFGTPKILELSGIGDPSILAQHHIEVRVENRYVGTNLQDHLLCGISFEAAEGVFTGDDLKRGDPSAVQWAMETYNDKSGPLCSGGVTSFAFLPTTDFLKDSKAKLDTLQSLADWTGEHPLDAARREILRELIQNGDEGTAQYFLFPVQSRRAGIDTNDNFAYEMQPGNFLSLVTSLAHPLSTGTAHISSSDPLAQPTIDHQYLSNPIDLELQARHTRFLETIAGTPPLSELLKKDGRRNDPSAFLDNDIEKAREFVKASSSTNYHSVGTCAMAPIEFGGVVDADMKVYGIRNLRIVDASIFPFVPQSNTQSLVYIVAERASELIRTPA